MSEQLQYNFCPVCGSALKNGKCEQCGYEVPGYTEPCEPVAGNFDYSDNTEEKKDIYGQVYVNTPVPRNDGKGLCAFLAVFSLLCIFIFGMVIQVGYKMIINSIPVYSAPENTKVNSAKYDGELSYYFKLYGSSLDDGKELVMEDKEYSYASEPYYVFDDYIDNSNGYKTVIRSWSYSNQDGWFDEAGGDFPKDLFIYCEYPTFTDTSFDAENLNNTLYYCSTDIASMYEYLDYNCADDEAIYLHGTFYATYMDEDVASILYYFTAYLIKNPLTDEETSSGLMTVLLGVNVNMHTGEIYDIRDVYNLDESFADTLLSECDGQNEGADMAEYFTREDIIKKCEEGDIIWVYTPIGVEFGVNYPMGNGFCTFSCFDRDKFKK